MIRVSGVVTLTNGDRIPFAGGPREFAGWEAYALSHNLPTTSNGAGSSASLTMMWYLAYACVTRGAQHRAGYLDWLDTLADLGEFEIEISTPTPPVASGESSDNSQSLPESDPPTYGPPTPLISQP